ncbi:telomere length regulation protein TEL2 homolog [Drosophila madeirensis]|uniref:Telomere length regulation protein TEL2 homolog n=1 Tax=Drosophila madeirensis TaxID=30013 RepID=A0AAU9EU32_DROMD
MTFPTPSNIDPISCWTCCSCFAKCENYQVFEGALGTDETLIRSQLARHDAKLALDLIRLFITLEMKFYFEDFERTFFRQTTLAMRPMCA